MSPGLVAARKMTFVRRERWHTKSPVSQKEHDETPLSSAEACELRTTAHPGTSLTPRGTKLFGALSDFLPNVRLFDKSLTPGLLPGTYLATHPSENSS